MSETRFTHGPWRWELNEKSRQLHLCGGAPTYDLTVMDFVRWGMGNAAPRFREIRDGLNLMHRCERWAVTCPGREHHEFWFKLLDHPDANLISAAPDLYAACDQLLTLLHEAINCGMPIRPDVAKTRNDACAALAKANPQPKEGNHAQSGPTTR